MKELTYMDLFCGCSYAAAADTVRVERVHDSDTVHCLRGDNITLKVRLQGIDAPELGQPFGKASRERLAAHGQPSTASC